MLCTLYTLAEAYAGRDIYIWNINVDSVNVFTYLSFCGINVKGFISMAEEYAGKQFMNRPVMNGRELGDSSLVVFSEEARAFVEKAECGREMKPVQEIMAVNPRLRHGRVILYGTGKGAENIEKILQEAVIPVDGYCITEGDGKGERNGKPVFCMDQLSWNDGDAVIITALGEKNRYEIMDYLQKKKIAADIYLKEVVNPAYAGAMGLFRLIDLAVKSGRKIFLYGGECESTCLLEEVLERYGVRISGYLAEGEQGKYKDLYSLAFEDLEKSLVVMNEFNIDKLYLAIETLEDMGFSIEGENYACVQMDRYKKSYFTYPQLVRPDALVRSSIDFSPDGGLPGWQMYGDGCQEDLKILVLGGSSTAGGTLRFVSWAEKLQRKLSQRGISNTVYNGALAGNTIVHEILRFLRDGHCMKPDIVISMSGTLNMFKHNSVNEFNFPADESQEFVLGVKSVESCYEFWLRNEKVLKQLVEMEGAEFFCFLQPTSIYMPQLSLEEKVKFEREAFMEGAKEFYDKSVREDFYVSLMDLLNHEKGMYIDSCHYTESGHEKIAEAVLAEIISRKHL